jgi:hypothetical protein
MTSGAVVSPTCGAGEALLVLTFWRFALLLLPCT